MDESFIPHHPLINELQIAMLPLSRDLPVVHSMLKWAKGTLEQNDLRPSFAWMLTGGLNLSHAAQVEKISALRKSAQEIATPLKELMHNILQFSSFKPIEKALIAFHKHYLEIPAIDNEIHLLYLGTDLFQNKELITRLLEYTEKLIALQEASTVLKKSVIDSLLKNLSFSLNNSPFKTKH